MHDLATPFGASQSGFLFGAVFSRIVLVSDLTHQVLTFRVQNCRVQWSSFNQPTNTNTVQTVTTVWGGIAQFQKCSAKLALHAGNKIAKTYGMPRDALINLHGRGSIYVA